MDLYNDGQPVDLVILADVLKKRKQLEDVGGDAYLAELWDAAPTAANAEYYAKIVRDKAIVRNLIHAGTRSSATPTTRRSRPTSCSRRPSGRSWTSPRRG